MEIKSKIGVFKYKQIISHIENSIESGLLKKGDKLPSINKLKKKSWPFQRHNINGFQ